MSENSKINWWKIGSIIVIILLLFGFGFYVGRKTIKKPVVQPPVYIELPPIHDTIYKPKPYNVIEPVDSLDVLKQCIASGKYYDLFPYKQFDTTIIITKTDSSKIFKDWATKRLYSETLFDIDTLGKCTYNAEVQFNELSKIDYTYIPIQKQTTITENQIKHYSPYIGLEISTMPSVGAEIGMFIDESWGFAIEGRYNINSRSITNNTNTNVSIQLLSKNSVQNNIILPKYDFGLKVLRKF